MILIKLHLIQSTKRLVHGGLVCLLDTCLCCGAESNNGSDFILNQTRQIIVLTNQKYDDFNMYLNTYLKEFNTKEMTGFHQCSGNKFEQFRQPNYYPMSKHISLPFRVPKYQTKVSNYKGFQKCLFNYCQNETLRLTNMLRCADNSIVDFHIDFVDRLCISNITHIHIVSDKITTIGYNNTSFFRKKINWNVVYLQLDVGNNSKIDFKCNSFKLLKSLRVITINSGSVKDFKCIFQYNPDLVKITSGIQRIWNLCDNNLEIWVDNNVYYLKINNANKDRDRDFIENRIENFSEISKGFDLSTVKNDTFVENRTEKVPEISKGFELPTVKDDTFVENRTEKVSEISKGVELATVKVDDFVENRTEKVPEISKGVELSTVKNVDFVENRIEKVSEFSKGFDLSTVKDYDFVENRTEKVFVVSKGFDLSTAKDDDTNLSEKDNPDAMFSFYLITIFLLIVLFAFGISKFNKY